MAVKPLMWPWQKLQLHSHNRLADEENGERSNARNCANGTAASTTSGNGVNLSKKNNIFSSVLFRLYVARLSKGQGCGKPWSSVICSAVLVAFVLRCFFVYQMDLLVATNGPDHDVRQALKDMVYINNPSFNCSDLRLKEKKEVMAGQHYHTFPSGRDLRDMCQSKYQQHCFRKNTASEHFPPPKFVSVLRDYEEYHERCSKVKNLTGMGIEGDTPEGCKYLVWKSMDGMGNQLLSLVCAFVYSLLTNRVMLIATDSHIDHYICNPFPSSSWILPHDFPEEELRTRAVRVHTYLSRTLEKVQQGSSCSTIPLANMTSYISRAPKHLHALIICCDQKRDHQFFCPTAQKLFSGVNWLFYLSHEHTLPGFYFIPEFRKKLNDWFPHHDVFMHASRYLLNPVNGLWAEILQFYKAHMDGVEKQIGIQPRAWKADYNPSITRQIQRCAVDQNLLPKPVKGGMANKTEALKRQDIDRDPDVAVFVTSLRAEYWENLHLQYANFPNVDGLHVKVVFASNESWQKTGDASHDAKAIIDIWLLSFMHDMVITPLSTFGSMASGLAGKVPLLFINYGQDKVHKPACGRTNVGGPCFIVYPVNQPCDLDPAQASVFDPSEKVPEVKFCDFNPGLGIESHKVIDVQ